MARPDFETRFKAPDNASDLARRSVAVKLPREIDDLVRRLPPGERGVWLRRVICDAAKKELKELTSPDIRDILDS